MIIGVIQASSQKEKNALLFETTCKYAKEHEVKNFGCFLYDSDEYSYIEISIEIGLLIASGAVDFVVTGCSSGQGMMLACNSMPGVICGYAPTPKDAYLFAQINNGNVISLPLGEEYTWTGEDNLEETIAALFSEPFGQGFPKKDAARKLKDTAVLREIRNCSQVEMIELLDKIDDNLIEKVLSRKNVIDMILANGTNSVILNWIKQNPIFSC